VLLSAKKKHLSFLQTQKILKEENNQIAII
jgi:hypothetical protein